MKIAKKQLLSWLADANAQLKTFDKTTYQEDRWIKWNYDMGAMLIKTFGDESLEVKRYRHVASWGRPIGGFSKQSIDTQTEERFGGMLSEIRGFVESLITQVEQFGTESLSKAASTPKRYLWTSPIFILERMVSGVVAIPSVISSHKTLSGMAALVGLIGSVASIVGLVIAL